MTATESCFVQCGSTVPLGLGDDLVVRPVAVSGPWTWGDRVLLDTDGLTEARDADGVLFPLLERVDDLRHPSPESCLSTLLHRVEAPAGRPRDDIALMLVELR